MFQSVLPELHKEAKKCIHSKINFQFFQDMLPTIRPQVASLSDMVSYTLFICLEGSRHLSHTGHPKMSTYATPMCLITLCIQDCNLPRRSPQEPCCSITQHSEGTRSTLTLTGNRETYNTNFVPLFKIKLVVFVLNL